MTEPVFSSGDPLEPLREWANRQPWYQKFSNTVTAGVGCIVGLLWLSASFGMHVPDGITKWVLFGIGALTVLGVYKTPNGVTESQLKKIQEIYVGKHRKPE